MKFNSKIISNSYPINFVTLIIYFLLFAFWLDKCAGLQFEKVFGLNKGLSLQNVILYILIMFWGLTQKYRTTLFQRNNLNNILFLAMILTAISLFQYGTENGGQRTSLINRIEAYKELITPWLYFILLTTIIRDKKTCERSIFGCIIFMIATVSAVLIQNWLGIDLGTQLRSGSYAGRSAGFSETNQYAAFLVLFLPIFLSLIFLQKEFWIRLKGLILLMIGVVGLMYTVSKGGFISFFVSVAYYLRLNIKQRMIDLKLVIASICMLSLITGAAYFLLSEQSKDVLKTRLTLQEPKYKNKWNKAFLKEKSWAWRITSGRTTIWERTVDLIVKKPILGYGYGADRNLFRYSTHSEPLKWLLNNGIIGFFVFFAIYLKIYRYVFYYYRNESNLKNKNIYLCYLSGFVGYSVAMLGVNMHEPRFMFWIYTAIIYSYIQITEQSEQSL